MSKKVAIIGAGINGLVAANYLRRHGCEVDLFEKKKRVGGACTFDEIEVAGKKVEYPIGASVFGMMQDFVFEETRLKAKVDFYIPEHPSLIIFPKSSACTFGDHPEYEADLEKVRRFLIAGFREAETPSLARATAALGEELVARWFTGTAKDLLDYYFTDEKTKIYKAMAITESGPTPLDSPFSAFTLGLMNTGTIIPDGSWGFVKGRLWSLLETLADINKSLGVKTFLGVSPEKIDPRYDATFLATDPVTASRLVGDPIPNKKYLGSSGKCVLFFREPVRWKEEGLNATSDAAFRFYYTIDTMAEFNRSTESITKGETFSPSCFQVYSESAAMRRMGYEETFDSLSVFFKDLAFDKSGKNLPDVQKYVEAFILAQIENPEAFLQSKLLSPKDLNELFFFPEGNIDHTEMCEGQNYFTRTFSAEPESSFYQFGAHKNVFYCGAGAYPCGSVAGTVGYMAAMQYLKQLR